MNLLIKNEIPLPEYTGPSCLYYASIFGIQVNSRCSEPSAIRGKSVSGLLIVIAGPNPLLQVGYIVSYLLFDP